VKVRDVRTLASINLAKDPTKKATFNGNSSLVGIDSRTSISRTLFTSRVLGDEVKVIVCPAFADSISEGDIRWEKAWVIQ